MLRIFWGVGKIGKEVFAFWKHSGIRPDYFCDNAAREWGTYIEDIKVLSPEEAFNLAEQAEYYITCNFYKDIYKQLLDAGIEENRIIRADYVYSQEMIDRISCYLADRFRQYKTRINSNKVVLDLSQGMVLGGVERTSYEIAEQLNELGIQGEYIVLGDRPLTVKNDIFPAFAFYGFKKEYDGLGECIKEILLSRCSCVLCNFPAEVFLAACVVKRHINPRLRIIAMIHNDEERYYEAYSNWRDEIDYCIVISSKIHAELIRRGFPRNKIRMHIRKVICPENLARRYVNDDETLRIGYAGRIIIDQKRVDHVIDIAEKLVKCNIDFKLDMIGEGPYLNELKKEIVNRKLSDYIKYHGKVSNEELIEFWLEHDIYLSCSEYEGRCGSQSEAMALGAVPVVTEVSGARDDIEAGVEGFIEKAGDVEALVSDIIYLSQHKDMLGNIGNKAHQKMLDRNSVANSILFWLDVFFE